MASNKNVAQDLTDQLINLHTISTREDNTDVTHTIEKPKQRKQSALVFWIETNQFSILPVTRIAKEFRFVNATASINAEGRKWDVKSAVSCL